MNKKWMSFLLVGIVSLQSVTAMASTTTTQNEASVVMEQEADTVETVEQASNVCVKSGEVSEVNKVEDAYEILVGSKIEGTRFIVKPNTQVINVETLQFMDVSEIKVGMKLEVVLNKNTPMTMSLPAICTEQVAILVSSEKKQVEVGYFNEELINEANTLKLNIEKDTMIQNDKGERRIFDAEDIKNKDAIVIYTTTTRSIPAQTTPEFVMILDLQNEATQEGQTTEEVKSEAEAKTAVVDAYQSVREVADTLGYEVKWDNETKTATLTKEDQVLQVTVGEKQYICNEQVYTIEEAAKLHENTLYIPKMVVAALAE